MFQRRGKEHIRYIRACAEKLFERSSALISFDKCLTEAMKGHREHIKKLMDATNHFNKSGNAGNYRPTHGGYSALNDN